MALPKPTNTLGKGFRVLCPDEVADLIMTGRLLQEIKPPKEGLFTDGQLTAMRIGQPLFCWYDGRLTMVAYSERTMKAWEVKELPKPTPTLKERIKQFFKTLKF